MKGGLPPGSFWPFHSLIKKTTTRELPLGLCLSAGSEFPNFLLADVLCLSYFFLVKATILVARLMLASSLALAFSPRDFGACMPVLSAANQACAR